MSSSPGTGHESKSSKLADLARLMLSERKSGNLPCLPSVLVAKSAEFSDLATALSERIVALEDWLNTLPGRVPVQCSDDGDIASSKLTLRFQRGGGKRWVFTVHTSETGWQPLAEADVDLKVRSSAMFSTLLHEIYLAQSRRVAELQKAKHELDALASILGLMEGK